MTDVATGRPRIPRLRSLRGRLVAGLLLVATLGLLAVDVAAVTALRAYLLQRLDDQLVVAAPTVVDRLLQGNVPLLPSSGDPGQVAPTDFVVQLVDDAGGPVQLFADPARLDPQRQPPVIAGVDAAEVVRRNGAPFSVRAGDGADYRAVALPLGSNFGAVIVSIPLSELAFTTGRLLVIEAVATAAVLALMVVLALVVVRVGLRPLTGVGSTARAIADGDLSRRVSPAEPDTEVGQLGLALNDMLAQIEAGFAVRAASEQRLRQFVADASHELRTPVTSIRGYAELHRQGAVTDPEHLARVMGRIEAEAIRMGALVNDLLLLTRLDQTPPVNHEPVDLGRVVADAVHDFGALEPDRPVEADLPAYPVMVVGDRHQLEQVLANLTSNVRTHVPATAPVRISLWVDGDTAVLDVADSGPGMPADVATRVFERFYRADGGRSRARGGAGLGLSIVAAIIAAHRGTVAVVSEPATGTTFRISLPVQPTP